MTHTTRRTSSHWRSKLGFIVAAAGSAVGLGNIWKFPYIAGESGGGMFVLVYLLCLVLLGVPIMVAEVLIGRTTQQSPVKAFAELSSRNSFWMGVGLLGVITGFVILSYYSVVGGWGIYYFCLSVLHTVGGTEGWPNGADAEAYQKIFEQLLSSGRLNVFFHTVFMLLTTGIVIQGVRRGIERGAEWLMGMFFLILVLLLVYAGSLATFNEGVSFVFGFHAERFTAASLLEALGHSFFTLSVGMGAILTYGSYLQENDDIVGTSLIIALLDSLVALGACLILFPITFLQGLEPTQGPGLVFVNIPFALGRLSFGSVLSAVFFFLLVCAALTSAISLLEVTTAYLIDTFGWQRKHAALTCSLAIFLLGIPSALSGGSDFFGTRMTELLGKNWFELFDYLASNWFLPLGGLGISLFVGWFLEASLSRTEFRRGSNIGKVKGVYQIWVFLLRYLVPFAIVAMMLHALELI